MRAFRKILIYWVPVVLWMLVIFSASADRKSMDRSYLIAPIIKFLYPSISGGQLLKTILIVRKFAHVGVYAVLAVLLWVAFTGTFELKRDVWNWRPVLWSMGLILLYAASDEAHQVFVPGRYGTLWDVLIDCTGGALGIGVVWSIGKWRRKW